LKKFQIVKYYFFSIGKLNPSGCMAVTIRIHSPINKIDPLQKRKILALDSWLLILKQHPGKQFGCFFYL